LKEQLAITSAPLLVQGIYNAWWTNLVDLLQACGDFVERPIFSLTTDFCWTPCPGLTLIGDAAHLMPPLGLGVNLAMLDASDLSLALVQSENWQEAIQQTEVQIMNRARNAMQGVVPAFASWFEGNE